MLARCARQPFPRGAHQGVLLLNRPCRRFIEQYASPPKLQRPPVRKPYYRRLWEPLVFTVVSASILYAGEQYQKQKKPDGFVPFVLVGRNPVSPTASIFYLEPKDASTNFEVFQDAWKRGIWNFQFKQSQIQVVRAYTPLPPYPAPDPPEPLVPLTSSIANDLPPLQPQRPALPFAQFTEHLQPQAVADDIPADQIPTIIQREWDSLSPEIRGLWDQRYEEQMKEYTEAMDNPQSLQKRQESANSGDGGTAAEVDRHLSFFIRNEQHGEVSGWLHRLPIGSEVELRGPNLEYEIAPETKHVLFLAGGTGIASALQAAHALLSRGNEQRATRPDLKDRPRIFILWASRNRDDCSGGVSDTLPRPSLGKNWRWLPWLSAAPEQPPSLAEEEMSLIVEDLEYLRDRYPGQVTIDYFVDAENTFINAAAITRLLTESQHISTTPLKSTEIIVSGPEGFVNYLAGPKEWRNGKEEQGPLNGILAQALQSSPHRPKVWKV